MLHAWARRVAQSSWHTSVRLHADCSKRVQWNHPGIIQALAFRRPASSGRKEAPASVPLATVEVRCGNAPKATYIQKADAAQELGLLVRDLRAVDPSFRTHSPAVLPRRNGIIINLAHVRLIILADRVLVFDPLNPAVEYFIPRLQARLDDPDHPMPFELRAVEAVLVDVCSSFNSTIATLIPSLDVVLDTLSTTTDFGGGTVQNCMDRLLPLENTLNEFSERVSQTRNALDEVLSSDVRLCLFGFCLCPFSFPFVIVFNSLHHNLILTYRI